MRAIRVLILAGATVLCAASAGPAKKPQMVWDVPDLLEAAPETTDIPDGVTDEDVYVSALQVLSREGYDLRDKDAGARLASTQWMTVRPALLYAEYPDPEMRPTAQMSAEERPVRRDLQRKILRQHDIRITADGNGMTMIIGCRERDADDDLWMFPCSTGDERDAVFVRQAWKIQDAILNEARKRAAQRMPTSEPAEPTSQPTDRPTWREDGGTRP